MFKKLVLGVVATGIALTLGTGGVSASSVESAPKTLSCASELSWYDSGTGKYYQNKFSSSNVFANQYTDSTGITWYFKGSSKTSDCGGGYYGHYEGR
ncbi:LCI fold-containing protein [Priestia taiwanensis]|uniref:LCI fold domain-containing protein n=1 Tax=Priestia taiwanensis TaxID=1347902 RepID=A0A917AKH9_9BACI|nr:LCI fold-containing protein [Priestia taiwanensis]MBM7361867.1 hypothetical protein [Priestia taiwanensis]GGE57553.1 hypothetical protein GCM10007140_04930 [Priestia taiwanensis]